MKDRFERRHIDIEVRDGSSRQQLQPSYCVVAGVGPTHAEALAQKRRSVCD